MIQKKALEKQPQIFGVKMQNQSNLDNNPEITIAQVICDQFKDHTVEIYFSERKGQINYSECSEINSLSD